jgi:hypothetical protein
MDRVFLVATLLVAGGFAYAGHSLSRYIGSMNTARVVGALMTAPLADTGSAQTFTGGLFGVLNNAVRMSMDQRQAAEEMRRQRAELQKQVAAVEVIAAVWRYAMWGVAGALALLAIIACLSGRPRTCMLGASAIILISTVATLVGMWLLMAPHIGGMPPLQARIYVYVAAAQSAYAWVLLAAYRRARGQPLSASEPVSRPF